MGNKALKIFYAVFMALILVALVVFAVVHVRGGLESQYAKLILGGYVLLLVWACYRLYTLIKNLLTK